MYQRDEAYCFVLADGLGGHGKGEVASQLAVESAVKIFAVKGAGTESLEASFQDAQKEILTKQQEDITARDMKTTLVILHVGADRIWWGHIGDSRLYLFQNGKLAQRTLDHSVPQMLVAAGQIKEKQYADWIAGYTGDILLVGINYEKGTKTHSCVIEKYAKA